MTKCGCLFSLFLIAACSPTLAQVPASQGTLTREQAEQIAVKNNPNISIGKLLALAQHQVVRQVRSAELPNLLGSISAVEPNDSASRISGLGITAPRLIQHIGGGVELTQLITDFGRTNNLVASSQYSEKAQIAYAQATTADILLSADQAFYNALEAQATLRVAQQTEAARRTVVNQVTALTNSKLKSTLDQSFAEVNLSQAQLLVLDAQNGLNSALSQLNAILGLETTAPFTVIDDKTALPLPPSDSDALVQLALKQRPDLTALDNARIAADKLRIAQRDQMLPTLNALGTVGGTAVGDKQYFPQQWYGAAGLSVEIPIFNGGRYSAQTEEADLRERAAQERIRDLRARIVQQVYTSWLAANAAFQRVAVTEQLLKQSDLTLQLAQTRYNLGLSSIVELSQAQLQQTESAIGAANARYQYGFALSTVRFQTGGTP